MKSCQEKATVIDKVVRSLDFNDLKQQHRSAFYIWTRHFCCSSKRIWEELIYAYFPSVFDLLFNKKNDVLMFQSHSISMQTCS